MGAIELADKAAEMGARIAEASEKTGMSAEHLSGLSAISKVTGESFDSLTTSLARAGQRLESAILNPGAGAGAVLAQVMGGAKELANLGLVPMDDALQTVLAHIFEFNNVGERNVALNALLGKGWQTNIETLKLLAEQGFAPAMAEAHRLGMYFDAFSAKQAKEYMVATRELKAEIAGLGVAIGKELMPYVKEWIANWQGMTPRIVSWGYAVKGAILAIQGNLGGAADAWARYEAKQREADQVQTDFRDHVSNLAAGEKKLSDETDRHLQGVQKHTKAMRDWAATFHSMVPHVFNLDNALANLDKKDLERSTEDMARTWKQLQEGTFHLDLQMPDGATKELQTAIDLLHQMAWTLREADVPMKTLSEDAQEFDHYSVWKKQVGQLLIYRNEFVALGRSTLAIDAAIYNAQRQLIEQEDAMRIRVGDLRTKFVGFLDELALAGKDMGEKVFGTLLHALDSVENELARFIVTGQSNFKQLFQSVAMEMTKSGLQDLFGRASEAIASKFGITLPAMGAQGSSPGKPLYVSVVNGGGGGLPGLPGGLPGMGGGEGGGGDVQEIPGGNIQEILGDLSGIFGGGRAGGGEVVPGKFYEVGERQPEFFSPRVPGQITTAPPGGGGHTVVNFHVNGVRDFDGFRRSSGQIMALLQNQLATAYSRNR